MAAFELHPKLRTDTHRLGRSGAIHILLHREATVPWFILVPEADNVSELHDLPPHLAAQLMATSNRIGRFVLGYFRCDKLNIGAIGIVVPQLHWHVIGRRRDDALWPKPVWGHLQAGGATRDDATLATLRSALLEAQCLA